MLMHGLASWAMSVLATATPLATCLHSMVGTLWGTDGYFRNPEVQALTDFGIGQVAGDDGLAEILQWNDSTSRSGTATALFMLMLSTITIRWHAVVSTAR